MARRKSSRGRVFYYPSSLPKMQKGDKLPEQNEYEDKLGSITGNNDKNNNKAPIIVDVASENNTAGTKYVKKDPATGLPILKNGGIPDRYKNKGFTKVGAKKQSTRPGKKWMVLAKKGDDYKVVHGGYKGMKDFSQHGSEDRKKKFWSRMGGKDSAKAKDPFSPLYWHKRFGTWEYGGDIQKQGYKDNSPYRNRRYIDIYSNNITMDGVSQPLRVKTDRGEERILEPNSGEYYFPGANVVREMPLRDTPLYFSPSSRGLTKYQTGGFLPMYEEGGDVSEENVTEEDVSDATIDEYIETLMQQENAAMKGYDAEKGLWFPHDAPEEGGGKDIGYGHKIKSDEDFSEGLTDAQVRSLLASDLTEKMDSAARKFNNKGYNRTWDGLSTEEQILLTDYEYNVGLTKFPKLMKAVAEQDIETMLSQYKRYSDGKPLTSRNNWTKGFIEDKINRVSANPEEETMETLKTTPIDNKVAPNVILNTFPQGQTQDLETKSSDTISNPVQHNSNLEKIAQAPYPTRKEQLGVLEEKQYTLDNGISPVVGNPFKGKNNYSRTRGPGEKGSGLYDIEGNKYSLVDYFDKKTGEKVGTYNPVTSQIIEEYKKGGQLPKAQEGRKISKGGLGSTFNSTEDSRYMGFDARDFSKPTIFTPDPYDPRLLNFNDSIYLANKSNSVNNLEHHKDKIVPWKHASRLLKDADFEEYMDPSGKITPMGAVVEERNGKKIATMPVYEQPTQPYVFIYDIAEFNPETIERKEYVTLQNNPNIERVPEEKVPYKKESAWYQNTGFNSQPVRIQPSNYNPDATYWRGEPFQKEYQNGGLLPKYQKDIVIDPATGLPKLKSGGKTWIKDAIKSQAL